MASGVRVPRVAPDPDGPGRSCPSGVPGSNGAHRSSEAEECRVSGPGYELPMPWLRTVRDLDRPTTRHGMTISTPRSAESRGSCCPIPRGVTRAPPGIHTRHADGARSGAQERSVPRAQRSRPTQPTLTTHAGAASVPSVWCALRAVGRAFGPDLSSSPIPPAPRPPRRAAGEAPCEPDAGGSSWPPPSGRAPCTLPRRSGPPGRA
jgi:hypothetical protein